MSGEIIQVRCVLTPGLDHTKSSARDRKVAHAPVCSGRNGSRHPLAPSSHAELWSESFANASNFSFCRPIGSETYLSVPGTSGLLFADRAARTMHTSCCTVGKIRDETSG